MTLWCEVCWPAWDKRNRRRRPHPCGVGGCGAPLVEVPTAEIVAEIARRQREGEKGRAAR